MTKSILNNSMETILVVIMKMQIGYCAYSEDVPGCISTRENMQEIKFNMTEAIAFHLEGLKGENDDIPMKLKGEYCVEFIDENDKIV
ncbi:type II toxin-antitoxin system HicB family antitoxin [Marinifilum fragile]|uniref:type II toxin-antitoxin system HicB family antitoxin n=1 Tax=Marinifilum fragile TaxID=570161 RepID=UPI002AAB4621|nr:type II toxin-antitoxin system HicB family antitoxin [Marinifilum fragile]